MLYTKALLNHCDPAGANREPSRRLKCFASTRTGVFQDRTISGHALFKRSGNPEDLHP